MLGRKDKKNKFHLPMVEEPKVAEDSPVANRLGNAAGEDMNPDDPEPVQDATEEEAEIDGVAPGGSEDANNRYHLVIVPDREPDQPHQSWEVYYRNRDFAGSVGDPLLTVVEADSQLEAEYKASHLQSGESSDIIAVRTKHPVTNDSPESQFSFPKGMPPKPQKPRPRIFRSK